MIRRDINLYARYNKPIGVKAVGGGKLTKAGIVMIVIAAIVVLALGGVLTYLLLDRAAVNKDIDEIKSYLSRTQADKDLLDETLAAVTELNKELDGSTAGIIDFIEKSPKSSPAVINAILDRTYNIENDLDYIEITNLTYSVNQETKKGVFVLTIEAIGQEEVGASKLDVALRLNRYSKDLEKEIKNSKGEIVGHFVVNQNPIVGYGTQLELEFIEAVPEGGNE